MNIIRDKKARVESLIIQGIKPQLARMYDYRCAVNQTSPIFDLSSASLQRQLGNHILICGGHKNGLEFLLEEVRKYSDVPICLMTQQEDFSETFNRAACKFTNVYWFKGNPMNLRHLKNANLKQA